MSVPQTPPAPDGTVRHLWWKGWRRLAEAGVESPRREAALLLGHVLGCGEASLWAQDDAEVDPSRRQRFETLVERRATGEPFAYLTGFREFFGRDFRVDSRVLVPRPETEHLIERALSLPLDDRARVLDVGTGSGILAVTLALERPGWEVWATDRDLGALEVARENARRWGVAERIRFVLTDWAQALALRAFDLLLSNPPYLSLAELATLPPAVRNFEPHGALAAGQDGFGASLALLGAVRELRVGAWVLLETAGDRASELARRVPPSCALRLVGVDRDLSGKERVAIWRREA